MWPVFIHDEMLAANYWHRIHIPKVTLCLSLLVSVCWHLHPVTEWVPMGELILSDHPRLFSNFANGPLHVASRYILGSSSPRMTVCLFQWGIRAVKLCRLWIWILLGAPCVSTQPPKPKEQVRPFTGGSSQESLFFFFLLYRPSKKVNTDMKEKQPRSALSELSNCLYCAPFLSSFFQFSTCLLPSLPLSIMPVPWLRLSCLQSIPVHYTGSPAEFVWLVSHWFIHSQTVRGLFIHSSDFP